MPQARLLLQLCIVLGAMGFFLLGQQTVFIAFLIIIFFQTIANSSSMPTSDAMGALVLWLARPVKGQGLAEIGPTPKTSRL